MENKDKLYLHINVVMDRDTDKQEYFWNKISSYLESMGMECLGSSEYQPLECIQEETKESNSTPLEPLKNGEREVEELEHFIEQELSKAREEVITEIYNFVESESGRSGRKEILEFISKLATK